jgi:hypothetical protein
MISARAEGAGSMRRSAFAVGCFLDSAAEIGADIIKGYFEAPGGLLGLIVKSADKIPSRHSSFERRCEILVAPYLPALAEKRSQLLITDRYGEVRHEKWSRELGHFMDDILLPRLGQDATFAGQRLPYVAQCLDDMVTAAQQRLSHGPRERDVSAGR